MKRILFTGTAILFAVSAHAASVVDVNSLNALLKKSHAGWVAKSTPINELGPTAAKRMLGLSRPENSVSFVMPHEFMPRTGLPAVMDWRSQGGLNWVSPILDQGNCGSCVAFASIGALETQYKIASGFAGFNLKLSAQNLFSCGGGYCDFGWQPDSAAQFLQTTGVPEESCLPYTSGATGQNVACSASCSNASSHSVKISSYTTPTRNSLDLNALRQALQKGPLVTTLSVYADFMAYSSGVYKHVTGEMEGGHAVSIVGYDDTLNAFIIRNSWGEGWGENGFAHVSYDDISGIGDATWGYMMPSMAGGVTIESPVDYTYVTGSLPLKVNSTYAKTDSMDVAITADSGKVIWSGDCVGAVCNEAVDVSTVADGHYSVQTTAKDVTGKIQGTSAKQSFYVANQKPALKLAFTGTNGTDLSQPLADRIEVVITESSSTVPMSSVEFHYRGADGKDNSRASAMVVNGMTMGWRTNLGPNGSYEIWMIGHVKTNGFDVSTETEHMTVTVTN